jgi:tRNA 5-methylaminomethyl-2-thiouridine biosynthesis bifunctional protein
MDWAQCRWLPFTPVAGQTTYVDAAVFPRSPRCVVRHDGYLIPTAEDRHLIGATYQRQVDHEMPDPSADVANLASLTNALHGIMAGSHGAQTDVTTAHSAIRMTSENRLPLAGPLPDPEALIDEYPRMLRRGYRFPVDRPVYQPGLYLSAAWGSRGMTNAALGGELLASLICGEPPPLQADLMHAIHPARNLVRRLKRGAG